MSISKSRAIGAALAIGAAGAAWDDEPGMTIYGLVDTDFQSIPSMSARKAQADEVGVDYAFSSRFKGSADVLYRENATLVNHTTGERLLANVAYLKNGGGYANQNQTSLALGARLSS